MNAKDKASNEIVPWIVLNNEAEYIHLRIIEDWNHLLDNPNTEPGAFRNYLHEHAGFFFHTTDNIKIVVANLVLDRNLESIDFMVMYDYGGMGFIYEFVKVYSPDVKPFTLVGRTSKQLKDVVQKIEMWQTWIGENSEVAKRLFPSKSFYYDKPIFYYTVYMGRRKNNPTWNKEIKTSDESIKICIRPFDWLTKMAQRSTSFYPILLKEHLGLRKRNELANPFIKAYSAAVWKEIVQRPDFQPLSHMVENNADIFIQNQVISSEMAEYLTLWDNLSETRKHEVLNMLAG